MAITLFDDLSDKEEDEDITSTDILYSKIVLQLLQLSLISVKEYNQIKDLYTDFCLSNVKLLESIIEKIENTDYKDRYILIDIINEFTCYGIKNFNIKKIINDFFNESILELTKDQKNTADKIINFIYNDEKLFLLEGYAGTGKTSLITLLLTFLLNKNLLKSILFTAPTNKAVNVINDKFNNFYSIKDEIIDFTTVHKMLKYKTEYDLEGNIKFKKSKEKCLLNQYSVIIVDECSMLEKIIVEDLINESKKYNNVKIILIGDSAQLPPVNEIKSSIFDLEISKCLMVQVVRSGNKNIVGACNNVRKWLFKEIQNPKLVNFRNNGFYIYKNNYKNKKLDFSNYVINTKWFKTFLKDNGIILAWTNNRVKMYNDIVRKLKFGNNKILQRFEKGDRLIFTDFYMSQDITKDNKNNNFFYTSEQIDVINVSNQFKKFNGMHLDFSKNFDRIKNSLHIKHIAQKTINQINDKTYRSYHIHNLEIKKCDLTGNKNIVPVLNFKSIDDNNKDKLIASNSINDLIKYYKTFHKEQFNIIEKYVIRNLWKSYNRTFIDPFAKFNYGFSTTVHKSQASSYNNVYIDVDDIFCNKKIDESKRCIYTAMTRAVDNLHLLI